MTYIVSKKSNSEGVLLVVTDSEIIGKKFEDGRLQLDLTKKFYQGDVMTKEEIKRWIQKSRYLHLTGKHSVAIGIEINLVDPKKIIYVKNIPHAEVLIDE